MRIAVGMSGGVDSSVSALLAKERGYEVIGITLRFHKLECDTRERVCCSPQDVKDAAEVSQMLGIPHLTIDWEELFKRRVVDEFIRGYSQGVTPNPCAICNREVKTGFLARYLKKVADIDRLITGHYARVTDYKGYKLVARGRDKKRDQSYFLSLLKREDIELLEFPLGELTKEEVREIAMTKGIAVAQKRDSQDVCFLMGKSVDEFLEDILGERPGFFMYKGKAVGKHGGVFKYTVGQRRGLGISIGHPVYVIDMDIESNTVYLGDKEDLLSDTLLVKDVNLHIPLEHWEDVHIQVRYRSRPVRVKDIITEDGHYKVILEEPITNITPGQVCAFYQSDYLLGGGIIER